MYMYYNAHPKQLLVGDCVKRAITLASGMDYMEVQRELNRYKKVTGAKAFNTDYNPHKYVENVLHGVKLSFPAEAGKKRMNGEKFCVAYPKGRYILNMAGHWSCCIDGIIYDTWDCSEKCVYTAYRLDNVGLCNPSKSKPKMCYNYTADALLGTMTLFIYDGNSQRVRRTLKTSDYKGYVLCLEDRGYTYNTNAPVEV